jgi:hypothetical protein
MKILDYFKSIYFFQKPFLLFLPFLILSIVITVVFDNAILSGDERNYLIFARKLQYGYDSIPSPNIFLYLGVGPGYPLVILPFIALHLPMMFISLLNTLFYYFSIIFLYKTLLQLVSPKLAFVVSIFWALCYNLYEYIPLIQPEVISPFLISAFLYFLVKSFNTDLKVNNKFLYTAGITFGFIALTKIIFGYVLLFMLVGNILLWLFNRKVMNYKKGVVILLVAFATTAPYLIFTFQLTGRVFYWGATGGNNMYWMSTPFNGEYGSWFPEPKATTDSSVYIKSITEFRQAEYLKILSMDQNIPGTDDYIRYNHENNFIEIDKYSGVEQDDMYKKLAFKNIRDYPFKYVINCISNLGRILFNYPYSYKLQHPGTLLRLPYNGIIVVLLLFSVLPTLFNWKRIPFSIKFSIFIVGLYMAGSITGSAETRMFTVIIPILLLWIAFILQKTVKIDWKIKTE